MESSMLVTWLGFGSEWGLVGLVGLQKIILLILKEMRLGSKNFNIEMEFGGFGDIHGFDLVWFKAMPILELFCGWFGC